MMWKFNENLCSRNCRHLASKTRTGISLRRLNRKKEVESYKLMRKCAMRSFQFVSLEEVCPLRNICVQLISIECKDFHFFFSKLPLQNFYLDSTIISKHRVRDWKRSIFTWSAYSFSQVLIVRFVVRADNYSENQGLWKEQAIINCF